MSMAHEEYKEMLAARALSMLDSSDNAALNEHLVVCLDCRNELKELEETSALLSYTAPPMEPSSRVRERILNEIRSSGRQVTTVKRDGESQVVPFVAPPRNVWSSIGSLGAIAASVIFIALLVSVVVLWRQSQAAKDYAARLQDQIKATEDQLVRERAVVQFLTTPGAQMKELAGTSAAPGASALLAHDKTGRAMLITSGLPAAPEGKAYQLWFIVGAKPLPGKVFFTDSTGSGLSQDQLPSAALEKAAFAVTMESKNGAVAPTSPILLMSDKL